MPTPPAGPSGGSDAQPQMAYTFWTVSRPDDPYYVTNWDRKSRIEVVADTREQAMTLADAAMGNAGDHRHWVFRLISVRDVRIPAEAS
jgi:hypothetical protein